MEAARKPSGLIAQPATIRRPRSAFAAPQRIRSFAAAAPAALIRSSSSSYSSRTHLLRLSQIRASEGSASTGEVGDMMDSEERPVLDAAEGDDANAGSMAADEVASLLLEEDDHPHHRHHSGSPAKDILDTAAAGAQHKGAKIHDFCLGIPYGALLMGGGALLYICTGSGAAIQLGLLLGGLLLSISVASMKAWKKGKSCLFHIQGQAAIASIILFVEAQKALQMNSVGAALVALVSGAMVAFYSYVFFSGGNPPPKKREATA